MSSSKSFKNPFTLIHSPNPSVLSIDTRFYVHALDDRDTTVGEGFFINNDHFDVHRFHPPLVYGRRGGPDDGEGIALCKFRPRQATDGETHQFLLITYLLPILSAKAVPQMVKFVETNCGEPVQPPAEATAQ